MGVVWTSADNTHWKRVPDADRTFSDADLQGAAGSGSTLVAVGGSQLDDTAMAPSIGTAWVSVDGTHWQRSPDVSGALSDMIFVGIAAGPPGFVAYGRSRVGAKAALAFSSDGLSWEREDAGGMFANSSIASVTWTGHGFAAVGGHDVDLPGTAAAWWSADGRDWHPSDVGSTGYRLESVQPWVGALRATGVPPCFRCVGPPVEWRSRDDGRTWRPLPPPTTPNDSQPTALLVGQRVVSLQDQPLQVSWSSDGETWTVLPMSGSKIPDGAQLVMATGQTVIAIASLGRRSANDQSDMRVVAGVLH